MPELKDLIHTRRLQIGKTLEDIGKEVGVSKSTALRWETGEIRDMRQGKLLALAKALETTPEYLMGWLDEPEKKPVSETGDELSALDLEILRRLSDLTPDERSKVDAFVQGLLANREA